jgi:hypothetical protein
MTKKSMKAKPEAWQNARPDPSASRYKKLPVSHFVWEVCMTKKSMKAKPEAWQNARPDPSASCDPSASSRIAGGFVGFLGTPKNAVHMTVVVSDPYAGIFGMDGQPTADVYPSIKAPGQALDSFKLIKVQFYYNQLPTAVRLVIPIDPPPGMSGQVFAQTLIQKAYSFASYDLPYKLPKQLVRNVMVEGEYNSNSFAAGLLQSVCGYVPVIDTPGFQVPGWENPIPSSYFKGEARR